MTKLILVRHGHVEGIDPPRFRGRLELPLTAKGRAQAESTADKLKAAIKPAAVYTSPMGRAVETGTAIATRFGLAIQTHPGLHDIDYGAWQGLTHPEAHAGWGEEARTWFTAPHLARIPQGESLQDLLKRGTDALHELVTRHAGETVVLVAHDSINRVILSHVLGLPLSRYWHLQQEPCCINEFEYADWEFVVRKLNETGHLT